MLYVKPAVSPVIVYEVVQMPDATIQYDYVTLLNIKTVQSIITEPPLDPAVQDRPIYVPVVIVTTLIMLTGAPGNVINTAPFPAVDSNETPIALIADTLAQIL